MTLECIGEFQDADVDAYATSVIGNTTDPDTDSDSESSTSAGFGPELLVSTDTTASGAGWTAEAESLVQTISWIIESPTHPWISSLGYGQSHSTITPPDPIVSVPTNSADANTSGHCKSQAVYHIDWDLHTVDTDDYVLEAEIELAGEAAGMPAGHIMGPHLAAFLRNDSRYQYYAFYSPATNSWYVYTAWSLSSQGGFTFESIQSGDTLYYLDEVTEGFDYDESLPVYTSVLRLDTVSSATLSGSGGVGEDFESLQAEAHVQFHIWKP